MENTLEQLFIAKQKAYEAYTFYQMTNTIGKSAAERVEMDLNAERAWKTYFNAKFAYDQAIKEQLNKEAA